MLGCKGDKKGKGDKKRNGGHETKIISEFPPERYGLRPKDLKKGKKKK